MSSKTSKIIVKRGTLGGGPWGYDVDLDGEQAAHTGTLSEADSFAEGLACGIAAMGGDADIEHRCRCGQWPLSEYGEECPSCAPVDQAAVRELAEVNPRHAIEGWLAGYEANGDAANAAECRAALELQATWRAARAS